MARRSSPPMLAMPRSCLAVGRRTGGGAGSGGGFGLDNRRQREGSLLLLLIFVPCT